MSVTNRVFTGGASCQFYTAGGELALALFTHYFRIFLVGSAGTFFHLTCRRLLGILAAIEMARKTPPLELSRSQILCFRRRVRSLDERLPAGTKSLRLAAWAGLQDSMPRAALLSIHARMEALIRPVGSTRPWSSSGSAVQRLRRGRAGPAAILTRAATGGPAAPRKGAGHRYSPARVSRRPADAFWPSRTCDGRVAQQPAIRGADGNGPSLRWDGSRQPVVWTVPPPEMDPWQARLELARRYFMSSVRRRPRCSPAGPGSEEQRRIRGSKGSRVR